MIVDTIYRHADERPDAPAVVHNGQSFTYARYAAMLATTIAFFAQYDLPRGKTGVVAISNLLSCWLAVNALRALGVNTITVDNFDNIRALGIGDVCCVVHAASGPAVSAAPAGARAIVMPDGFILDTPPDRQDRPMPVAECGGHYIYTSGTTGNYKVLLFPGDMVETNSPRTCALYGLEPGSRFGALYFPLYTGASIVSAAAWMAGSCVALEQRPDALLRLMSDQTDVCLMVPAMLEGLLQQLPDAQPPASFRLFIIGGFVSSGLAERVAKRITPHVFVQYGSSECGALARSEYHSLEDLIWLTPEPWRELSILAPDGSECPPGTEGEMAVRLNATDRTSYVNDPEATAHVFRDGYFFPGDMAVRREDGKIRILGRTADVINIMGFKRPVGPFEEEIRQLLGARGVCLFASQDENGREILGVAIESDTGPSDAEAEAIRSRFPRKDVVIRVFESFPRGRTAMQKVDRRTLRKLVFA